MTTDPFDFPERVMACAPAARFYGDPLPQAFIDHHLARRAETAAWQRVAVLAQRQAHSVCSLSAHARTALVQEISAAVAHAATLTSDNRPIHDRYQHLHAQAPTAPDYAGNHVRNDVGNGATFDAVSNTVSSAAGNAVTLVPGTSPEVLIGA